MIFFVINTNNYQPQPNVQLFFFRIYIYVFFIEKKKKKFTDSHAGAEGNAPLLAFLSGVFRVGFL